MQTLGKIRYEYSLVSTVGIGSLCAPSLFNVHTSSSLQGDKSVRVMRSLLAAQQTFVDRLVQLMKAVQRESGNRKKKVLTEFLHVHRFCVLLCKY